MLQIDHVYEFFCKSLFKDFRIYTLANGVMPQTLTTFVWDNFYVFNKHNTTQKIFFIDQEPVLEKFLTDSLDFFDSYPEEKNVNLLVTSEFQSAYGPDIIPLYYFFHGFAALDWYRGFHSLNFNKQFIKNYQFDYVSFNRLVTNDRSYRCYFISQLVEKNLIDKGQVSFNLSNEQGSWHEEILNKYTKLSPKAKHSISNNLKNINGPLIIDNETIYGWASADIPRCIDNSLWHVVTETVFYYNKLHLTEKIFKPIVMKQPFMLLASPGNLAYLRRYGFKTFEGIIDESYDTIQDHDARVDAVVDQLNWYCNLSQDEKSQVIERLAPIVEYNFNHFYGAFRHIIAKELLTNCQTLFKEIGYDDKTIAYNNIYKVLTN